MMQQYAAFEAPLIAMTPEQIYYNYYCMLAQSQHHANTQPNLDDSGIDTGPYYHPQQLQPQYTIMDTRDSVNQPQQLATTNAMPIPQQRTRFANDFTDLYDIDQSQSPHLLLNGSGDHELTNFSTLIGSAPSMLTTTTITAAMQQQQQQQQQHQQQQQQQQNQQQQQLGQQQQHMAYGMQPSTSNSNAMWSVIGDAMTFPKLESFHMDDDDIFQVDKNDLYQGPTLAELNDDRILEDLNIDDYILQAEEGVLLAVSGSASPQLTILQPQTITGQLTLQQQQQLLQQQQQQHQQSPQQSQHMPMQINAYMGNEQFLQQQQQQQQQQQPDNNQLMQLQHQQHQQLSPDQNQTMQDLHSIPLNDLLFNNMFDTYQTSTPTHSIVSRDTLSPQSHTSSTHSSTQQLLNSSASPPLLGFNNNHMSPQNSAKYSTLQELLRKEYRAPDRRPSLGQSMPGPSGHHHMAAIRGVNLHQTQQRQLLAQRQQAQQAQLQQHQQNQQQLQHPMPGTSGTSTALSRRLQLAHHQQQLAAASRLSSSAPSSSHTTPLWESHQMWQRREPRPHLLSTGSVAEGESTSSLSTSVGVLSPEAQDFSHDEGYDDSDDSDHYEDCSSDNDSDTEDGGEGGAGGGGGGGRTAAGGRKASGGSKKERFFWQYNVQSKGPKGTRLVIKTQAEDPHVLNEVTDPVFSPNCSVRGIKVIKHSGKARKGDGNDLTPNPRKLFSIGKELDKLGRIINDMTPVAELPMNVRPKSRKEKNKLASRACRLKKKAQHEANKIKLYGLETEHKRLLDGLEDIKKTLALKHANPNKHRDETNAQIDSVAQASTQLSIAGTSTEFVNGILEKVKAGIPSGGLEEI